MAGSDEKMVGKAVKISEKLWIQRLGCAQRHRGALRTANDRAGKMQRRNTRGAARQDEAGERREIIVHRIDLALEPLDLAADDAQRPFNLARCRDVGAKVEQVVLDAQQLV